MAEGPIKFEDGAGYERMMGVWSRLAGDVFLDWLAPEKGLRWVDVGCGNGAFTELLARRCAPSEIRGIDPSAQQIEYARKRPGLERADLRTGDAMALPYADASCDAATMALVIFFVPDPAKGVAEMARVVRPGGSVSAYAWDMLGGGFPLQPMRQAMTDIGRTPPLPPRPEASRIEALRELWRGAGLVEVATREIVVSRSFPDFEDYFATNLLSASMIQAAAAMTADELAKLKERVRANLPGNGAGRIEHPARANAVKGRAPNQ